MRICKAAFIFMLGLGATGWAQQTGVAPSGAIRVESRQVQVDAVVADKKGAYASDLKAADFKLFEDGKEQAINSVMRVADNNSSAPEYIVLLFDRMSMDDQRWARNAAKVVAQSVIGKRRFLAIASYEGYGSIRIDQAPSNNAATLLSVIENMRSSSYTSGGAIGQEQHAAAAVQVGDMSGNTGANRFQNAPSSANVHTSDLAQYNGSDTEVRNMLTALTSLCKSLGTMPGRKTIVWMTYGMNLSHDDDRYVTTLTETANKGNISFYPVQVILDSGPRQALRIIAHETGGFCAGGNNDLQGALEMIQRDQLEYYLLSYTPSQSAAGACHKLTVKTARDNLEVRARKEYCSFHATDPLAGSAADAELEAIAKGSATGSLKAEMTSPFFYNDGGTAKLAVSSRLNGSALQFVKNGKSLHANVNVLGVAYRPDGAVAARFSDTIGVDAADKADAEKKRGGQLPFSTIFELPAGAYNFDLVFSSGRDSFAKVESTVRIDEWDGKSLAVSGIALSKEIKETSSQAATVESVLSSNHARLVSNGYEYVPASNNVFKQSDTFGVYFEIYDPELTGSAEPNALDYRLKIVDLASSNPVMEATLMAQKFIQQGNPVVAVGVPLKVSRLAPGKYRLLVEPLLVNKSNEVIGRAPVRSVNFEVAM